MATFVLEESERNQLVSDADYRQQYYGAMQLCASAIEEIINDNSVTISREELDELSNDTTKYGDDYKHHVVEHHVAYLETMVDQDFWTTEDMTAINQAITDGKAY